MSASTGQQVVGGGARTIGATADEVLGLYGLVQDYSGCRVLGPVELRLDVGVLAVVYGPNGAGKTTLLRVAAGLLAPSEGTRRCAGRTVYLRAGAGARHPLTVATTLSQTAALAGTDTARLAEVCSVVGLDELADRRVGELSTGQRARLSAALAVAADPVLACLDEPTAHLDAGGVQAVRAVVQMLRSRGTSVLLAGHTPDQFADLAQASLRLEHGLLRETRC